MRLALLLVRLVLIQVPDCPGIPVFMTTSMRVMGIAQIVKEKMEKAQFSAMLSLFMKISCSVESQVCRRDQQLPHHCLFQPCSKSPSFSSSSSSSFSASSAALLSPALPEAKLISVFELLTLVFLLTP